MTHVLLIARHGRYRDKLIRQPNIVGAWSLGERIQPIAKSIIFPQFTHLHGTWIGTGTTRGVPSRTILEGEAGATFDGNGGVEVSHDPGGYRLEGDTGPRALSLHGGDYGIRVRIRTTHNDSVLRAIAQKQETDSSGIGWHLAMKDGQIRGFAKVAAGTVFDFAGDYPITDDQEHLVTLLVIGTDAYLKVDAEVVAQTTAAVELEENTGNLRFGMFNDDAGGFIGSIWLPALEREGTDELDAELQRTTTWYAITTDLRVEREPIVARHGSADQSPVVRTAGPAQMECVLDNSNLNEAKKQGFYTPGHVDALPGFLEGAPIWWRVTDDDGVTRSLFRGFIEQIDPKAGTARSQECRVRAESWFAYAMRAPVGRIPVQVNLRSDDAIRWVLDQATRSPVDVDLAVGDVTFPIVFQDLDPETSIYQALARVVFNEFGRLYERRDGTLVYENSSTRYLTIAPHATWTEYELEDLDAARAREEIVNLVRTTITPTRVSEVNTDELASMSQRIEIPPQGDPGDPNPAATVDVELHYRDPLQPSAEVGGMDLITPVAGTDYSMFEFDNGTGADLTAFAGVSILSVDQGGRSALVRITGTHGVLKGYFLTRLRGRKLTTFDDQTWTDRDDESIRAHDPRPLPGGLQFDYLANEDQARGIARRLIALRKDPFMAPRTAVRRGVDVDIEADIVARDVGDMVHLQESMTALDGTQRTFIDGIELAASVGPLVATYALSRGPATQVFWILEEPGYSELDETMVLG